MSINSKLVTFAQQDLVIARNDTERDNINRSLSHLETVLRNKLGTIKEFIRFGSFTRNTILPRKYDAQSDVDLMVVFNTNQNKYTPETYRKWLLDVISNSYPNSISKKDFPVVKLELNHIMFDIVPAYCEESGYSKTFYIPNKNYVWQQTVPNDINASLSTKNQQHGNNIVRNTIRLCKCWNANAGYPFESYLMEKEILNLNFWGVTDTYESFLKAMDSIAWNKAGVRQALDYIKKHKGSYWEQPNEEKQLQWLKKLLFG